MHQTCIIIGKVEWKPAAANMVHFLGSVTSRGLKLVPAVVRCLPLVDGGGTAEEVHHPLPGHRPYISQRFRNLSKSNPTRRHPPFQDIGSPTNQLSLKTHQPNESECIPLKTHQPNESECIPLKSLSRTAHHAPARRQSHLVLILVSLLACKQVSWEFSWLP